MLDTLHSAGSFIVAIGVLVAFHEFGHFWVARRFGIKVLKFSIGFGRPLWSRRGKDGVEYIVAMIPLGGYVKLLDEREADVVIPPQDLPFAFNRQSVWKRIAVFAAGPVFNFLLAIAFYWLLYMVGVPGMKPVIDEPPSGTVAAKAGFKLGEQIVALDDKPIATWSVLRGELLDQALNHGDTVFRVRAADGSERSVKVDLRAVRIDPALLFDDLGFAQLGCYGGLGGRIKTPHIDRLARTGVRFARAYNQIPLCNPSRASMIAGLRPEQTGVANNTDRLRQKMPDVVTLPQLLKEDGRHAAAFGKIYHLGGGRDEPLRAPRHGHEDVGGLVGEVEIGRAHV